MPSAPANIKNSYWLLLLFDVKHQDIGISRTADGDFDEPDKRGLNHGEDSAGVVFYGKH